MSTIQRRRQRALVVAALLVVAAILIAVQYSRLGQAEAPAGPDDPPPGVNLFFARDPGNSHGLLAYDWAGNRRGSIKVPTWVEIARLRVAPDGSGFLLDPSYPGDYVAYFDRLGQTVVETEDPSFTSQVWAAEGRNVCVMSAADAGLTLATRISGFPNRGVVVRLPDDLAGGQVTLRACSSRTDTAILQVEPATASGAPESRMVRLRLSSGAVLNQVDVGTETGVVSQDGAFLAIGSNDGRSQIYRTADFAAPVATLPPGAVAAAFSGDDSMVLASNSSGDALEVLEWRSGKEIWHRDVTAPHGPVVVRPGGGDFAIEIGGGDPGTHTIVVAHRNGQTTTVGFRDLIGG